MALDIDQALREGYERTIASNGVILAGAFFVLSAVNALVVTGTGPRYPAMRFGLFGRPAAGSEIVLPPPIAGLISLLAGLGTIVLAIAALRTFVTDETEHLPEAHFRDRMGWAFLNFLVGAIVFGIAVAIGFVFLVVPGLFMLVSLIFWEVFVAVEGQNFLEAFENSWQLARGHRWQLFGLGFVVLLVTLVVNAAFGLPGALVGGLGGILVSQAGSALTTVFGAAVLARTYVQLAEPEPELEPGTESPSGSTGDGPDEAGSTVIPGNGDHEETNGASGDGPGRNDDTESPAP